MFVLLAFAPPIAINTSRLWLWNLFDDSCSLVRVLRTDSTYSRASLFFLSSFVHLPLSLGYSFWFFQWCLAFAWKPRTPSEAHLLPPRWEVPQNGGTGQRPRDTPAPAGLRTSQSDRTLLSTAGQDRRFSWGKGRWSLLGSFSQQNSTTGHFRQWLLSSLLALQLGQLMLSRLSVMLWRPQTKRSTNSPSSPCLYLTSDICTFLFLFLSYLRGIWTCDLIARLD